MQSRIPIGKNQTSGLEPSENKSNNVADIESTTKFPVWKVITDWAIGLFAPKESPVLTGTPTAPTAPTGTNTLQIATTAFVLANGGTVDISGKENVGVAAGLDAQHLIDYDHSLIGQVSSLQDVTIVGNQTDDKVIVEGVQFNNYTRAWNYEILGTVSPVNSEVGYVFISDYIGNFYFSRANTASYTNGNWIGKMDSNGVFTEINLGTNKSQYIAVDSNSNLYTTHNNTTRTITKLTSLGVVSTLATIPYQATAIAVDDLGNVYVSELNRLTIRKITPNGIVSQLNGIDLPKIPSNIEIGKDGNLYVALSGSSFGIAKVLTSDGSYTVLGNAAFSSGAMMSFDSQNNIISIRGDGTQVIKTTQTGVTSVLYSAGGYLNDIVVDENDYIYVSGRPNSSRTTLISPTGEITHILIGEWGEDIIIPYWDSSPYYFSTDNLTVKKIIPPASKVLTLDNTGNIVESNKLTIQKSLAYLPDSTITDIEDANSKVITTKEYVDSVVASLKGYTVSTLPPGTIGMCAFVTDALSPAFGADLVGGGSVVAKAFFNGTTWINE